MYLFFYSRSTKEFTKTRSEMLVHSRTELAFGNAGFWGEGETEVPGEKPSEQSKELTNRLMTPGPGGYIGGKDAF